MRAETQKTIRLSEYAEPHHWVETVHLTFKLAPKATRVISKIMFMPNPNNPGDLVLDGADVTDKLVAGDEGLTLPAAHLPPTPF